LSHHAASTQITKYQGSTFKKECDVDTTLLPGPKWT
jgi:hypothetical protein